MEAQCWDPALDGRTGARNLRQAVSAMYDTLYTFARDTVHATGRPLPSTTAMRGAAFDALGQVQPGTAEQAALQRLASATRLPVAEAETLWQTLTCYRAS